MTEESFKRKLTAILSADVKDYSRLMEDDEAETVRTLNTYRTAISDLIQKYRGRVVDATGDNIMAEFTSVVDAVNCAVEIQRDLAERNAELAYERRMEFRIGVNLGDVIDEDGRIYGDGVNIAARVESLAEGGGICISGRAYDQVANKLGLEYENLGEHQVKNISTPIRVYRVLSYPGAAAHRVVKAKEAMGKKWRKIVLAAAAALLVVAASAAVWNYYLRPSPVETASVEKMAFPLPDKPSIAVLPFINMSGDPEQEYFSDGLTEEIITSLSKTPKMFVIARNSTFSYKGQQVKIQQVAEELGVRYILEGSLRKSEDRVRVTAQLIDAITGGHLWAERYDKDLKDIFALQDQITLKILNALQVKLTEGEQARMWAKGTDNLEAYAKWLQGREHAGRQTKEANALARQLSEEAIALDSEYSGAYSLLGRCHLLDVFYGWSESPGESLARAFKLLQKALTLDESSTGAHAALGTLYLLRRQHEKAIAEGELAVALNPNAADAHARLAMSLNFGGRPEESMPLLKKAIRLNPMPPDWYLHHLAFAYFLNGQCEEVLAISKKILNRNSDYISAYLGLANCNAQLGRMEEARAAVAEILRIDPKTSLKYWEKALPFKKQADKELFFGALRKAGLPE
jgi:adenylate cyclase